MPYLIRLLIGKEAVYKAVVQEKESITFGGGSKDTVFVRDWLPGQLKTCIKNGYLYVTGKRVNDLHKGPIASGETGQIVSDSLMAAINWVSYSGISEREFYMPYRGIVTIGRSNDNTITLSNATISAHHAVLVSEDGVTRVEDGNNTRASSNGTYLNGRRITKAVIKSGDVLDLMNIRIILHHTSLKFENAEGILSINQDGERREEISSSTRSSEPVFRRSPRLREGLPQKDIVLAKAPSKERAFQKRRGMFSSLLSSGAMIGVSVATGMASPALLAARAAGLVAPVANLAAGRGDNKKGKKLWEKNENERRRLYGAYIESQKAVIEQTAQQQRSILTAENPAPETSVSDALNLKPNLWERRPNDSDFLDVRIGMGYEPLCVEVKTPSDAMGFQMEVDEAELLAKQIVEETRIVDNVPVRVSLRRYATIGVVGKRRKVVNLLKNMIVSLTAAHYNEDVQIVGIFAPEERREWEALRWLPHVWDLEKQSRFLAFDQESAERLCDSFHDVLRNRLSERKDSNAKLPNVHIIFLLGSHAVMKRSKLMTDLLNNDPYAGATAIFAYNLDGYSSAQQRTFLPPECQYIIDTDDTNGPSAYEFAQINKRILFTQDPPLSDEVFDSHCRRLSAIRVESGAGKLELPSGITFLEGFGVSNVRELNVWERWNRQNQDTVLGAQLAVMSNGKMLELDVGDFTQPPVSLVAGMSGSGKSEFLKTWILSLAVQYSPEDLSMVIIDYKGGSMAHSVENLPHVVGKITDIESGDIMRPLASLDFEVHRRERIFKDNGVLEYKEYRRGLLTGRFHERLPMLLIICDEFAELKLQHRDFMAALIRVARLGRSCGVRLILATQSPAGVVDQDLFDNSRFQICLKVQNAAASKSMIGRADAARLTQNGRAYVRAGSDEIFELVQSYWTGAPYLGNREKKASAGNQVRIVDLSGQRIKTVWEEKTRFKSETNELQAVTRYINSVVKEHGVQTFPCPWKPELPTQLHLTELNVPGGFDGADWRPGPEWLSTPIGLYDRPDLQAQGVQYLNLEAEGHYGIYGLPGTGKTVMLKTILMSFALYYSPRDVNFFILDLGSQTMKLFGDMPHVSVVALGSEEEKLQKTEEMLEQMLAERKKTFASHGISSLKNYRQYVSDEMPAVILAIDNLQPLFELCPSYEPLLYRIGSEGPGCGIYLIYTSNSTSGIRYKLTQNIHSGIAFEMNSKTDYTDAVGKVDSPEAMAKMKGRGFFRDQYAPVVFQAALYGEGTSEMEWSNWVKAKIEEMNRGWDGPSVQAVPVMPETIPWSEMAQYYLQRDYVPVGMDCADIRPAFLNIHDTCGTLVAGLAAEEVSAMLTRIQKLMDVPHQNRFYIMDSARTGLASLMEQSEEYTRTIDLDGVDTMLTGLIKELIQRESARSKVKTAQGDSFDLDAWLETMPQLCLFIDDLSELTDLLENAHATWKRFNALVKNAHGLGMVLLAGARADNLQKLSTINPVAAHLIKGRNGLAVSGSAAQHSYYPQKNLGFEEKNAPLKPGYGWLYCGEEARKIKLIEG